MSMNKTANYLNTVCGKTCTDVRSKGHGAEQQIVSNRTDINSRGKISDITRII